MDKNKPTIVFCDFDGTITNIDIYDCILETHLGKNEVVQMSDNISNHITTISQHMNIICQYLGDNPINVLNYVVNKFEIHVDTTLYDLYNFCHKNGYMFKIISGNCGMFIKHLINVADNDIVSHNIEKDISGYKFVENTLINPKYKYIKRYFPKDIYNVIYIGDGISDFSVVNDCTLLFAKNGSVLEKKCIQDKICYTGFNSLNDVVNILLIYCQ